jgi:hypothetical protein
VDPLAIKIKPTYKSVRIPLPFRVANWIGAAVQTTIRRPIVSLSPSSLWAAAERRSGLRREEDLGVQEPLERLVRSLTEEAELTTLGRYMARQVLVLALANRLLIQRSLLECPEILETRVDQPLFVAGFARTGTTLLHRLLALDDAVRAPALWEFMQPAPPPMPAISPSEKRVAELMAKARPFAWLLSHFAQIHQFDPLSPDECSALRNNTLVHEGFLFNGFIPAYLQWLRALDAQAILESYRQYKSQVQILAYHFPGRRWVSKSPIHCLHLDRLLSVFPSARIVRTLRNPAEAIPSAASLFAVGHAYFSRVNRPRELGRMMLDWYQQASDSYARARACVPGDQFVDVEYSGLVRDPIAAVRAIYGKFGLELHPAHEAAMKRWLVDSVPQKHGKHHYSLEEFGLSEADIRHFRS